MAGEEDSFAGDQSQHPEDWPWHHGPAGWFRFQCPANCHVRIEDSVVEIQCGSVPEDLSAEFGDGFTAPSGRQEQVSPRNPPSGMHESESADQKFALQIGASWIGDQSTGAVPPAGDLLALFPDVVFLKEAPMPRADSPWRSWQGISRPRRSGWSWNQWFVRRPSYQWKCWTLVRNPIMIQAVLQSRPGQILDVDFVAQCERIIASIQLATDPPWPPDVFRLQVIELARKHFPLLRVSVSGAFSVRLEDSEIHLHNFYRAYILQPEYFRRIVLPGITAVVRLQELSPEQMVPPLDQVVSGILPMLAMEDRGSGVSDLSGVQSSDDGLVRMPWVAGLCVSFVLDETDSYRFINHEMLDVWQIDAEELQELALYNLRRYVNDHPLEVTVIGERHDPRMLMPLRPDAYNCVRLLDSGFHSRLREMFGPELLVGLPNRDFFVAVSLNHPSLIQEVQDRVQQDYTRMHYPLTQRLLVISADGVSEYC